MRKLRIAIARDPAFCFLYRENIARLARIGNITWFSPVYGYELPEADLIYLPGGYPELFARQLHRRHKMMEALKEYAEKGGKIFAECGGMVFLGRSLTIRQGGTAYPMSGILPLDFTMEDAKLQSGYRKTIHQETEFRGNEFHYYRGPELETPFYRYKNVIASYVHWYWGDKDLLKLWE